MSSVLFTLGSVPYQNGAFAGDPVISFRIRINRAYQYTMGDALLLRAVILAACVAGAIAGAPSEEWAERLRLLERNRALTRNSERFILQLTRLHYPLNHTLNSPVLRGSAPSPPRPTVK